jgi:hypothetical protein
MTIRISRNETGNCINFIGSTNPSYWNACLSASLNQDDATRVDIINDIRSENSATIQYEFYAVDPNDFSDKDGNSFLTPQDMVDYVNVNANVSGVSDVGADLTGVDVNFRLDATSTSIILDNGSAFGVNTIKAVANADGTIHLHAIGAGSPDGAEDAGEHRHFEKLEHTRVSVNGTAAAGGLNDVVNLLNELFTVGAFESVVIADPYSTMIADVAGVNANGALAGEAINPATADVAGATATHNNKYGWLSSDTIDQAGEYFTFDIRVEGTIGMGLVCADAADVVGNATYGNPATFCDGAVNSSHYGYQFAHYFHPTPNGPWTNYGANTGYVAGPGWSNVTHRFMSSPEGADWLAGNPVKMRVGIDTNGFISIDYYDASESAWIVCARTSYPVAQGVEYKLGIKFSDSNVRLFSAPKIHELAPAAPTMYFRYIESPDGNFEWPLFATEEEANYYDLNHGGTVGTGTSHTHTYADDATNTTWYMADTGSTMSDTAAPSGVTFAGAPVTFTEITSLTDADLTPPAYAQTDISQEEGTAVNLQVTPAGATWSTSVTISPSGSGLVYDGNSLVQGTLADVGADTAYTITVVRANSYGSSTGSMTLTATNVAPTSTNVTPWTKALDFSGSNEHASTVSTSSAASPLQMAGASSIVSAPTTAGNTTVGGYPWATAIVFKSDGNNSNQHIWNQGEGAGSIDDNIYVRQAGDGNMYFGWGRSGAVNECHIGDGFNTPTQQWYGLYIAHNGERLSGTNATAANLADCFDIRFMRRNVDNNNVWEILTGGYADGVGNRSTSNNWNAGSIGARMDRSVLGGFTIGGRGSNRNFHGKIASMVVTTLRNDLAMPTDAEITLMVTDPKKWEDDYRDGQFVRWVTGNSYSSYTPSNRMIGHGAVQIWLMGDGGSDSYANGIRNEVYPDDQNYTKLQLNSMVSNDIETVSIAGLT